MNRKVPDPVTLMMVGTSLASAVPGILGSMKKEKDPAQEAAQKAEKAKMRQRSILAEFGGRNLTDRTQGQALGAAPVARAGLGAARLGGV